MVPDSIQVPTPRDHTLTRDSESRGLRVIGTSGPSRTSGVEPMVIIDSLGAVDDCAHLLRGETGLDHGLHEGGGGDALLDGDELESLLHAGGDDDGQALSP